MTYTSIVQMSQSQSLLSRVAACAAEQGNVIAQKWASDNLMALVSDAAYGFVAPWDYAMGNDSPNFNPDTGARTDVISDQLILAAVQDMKTKQGAGNQGWPSAA